MKSYKKHIDTFIREKAGRDSQTPPSHIWESLDKKLDDLTPPAASYRRLRYFALLSLILLLSVFVVKTMIGNSNPETNNTANTGKTTAKTHNNTHAPDAATTAANSQAIPPQSPVAANNTPNTNTGENAANKTGNEQPQPTAGADRQDNTPSSGSVATISKSNAAANTDKKETKETSHTNRAGYADNGYNDKTAPAKTKHKQNTALAYRTANNSDKIEKKERKPAKQTKQAGIVQATNNYNSSAPGTESSKVEEKNQPAGEIVPVPQANQPSSLSGTAKKETSGVTANENSNARTNTLLSENKAKPLPGTTKKESINNPVAKKDDKEKEIEEKNKLEEGIKAGYEGSFNNTASKYVIAPYIQYNVSPKISLLTQPAIKYGKLSTKNVGTSQSYYQVNDDGAVTQNGNSMLTATGADSSYTTKYTYQETHDSIVKSYVVSGTYMEFELPILLKYYLAKKVSVFGGVNLIYTKLTGITERTYTQQNIPKSIDFATVTPYIPTTLPPTQDISYPGTSISNYSGPLYHVSQPGQFHVGYMIGFGYELNTRWLFDGLVQQSPVKQNMIGGYNVNAPLSAPYFRLSIGYRLQNNIRLSHKDKLFGTGKDTGRGD